VIKSFKNTINIKDIIMIIGLLMLAYGLYAIYKPSMYLIIGLFLIFLGWPSGKGGD